MKCFCLQAPLAKTDEIVLLGGSDRTTNEVNKLVSQLPPAISGMITDTKPLLF